MDRLAVAFLAPDAEQEHGALAAAAGLLLHFGEFDASFGPSSDRACAWPPIRSPGRFRSRRWPRTAPTWALLYSGSPALRRPSSSRWRSWGRRSGTRSPRLDTRSPGSSWRRGAKGTSWHRSPGPAWPHSPPRCGSRGITIGLRCRAFSAQAQRLVIAPSDVVGEGHAVLHREGQRIDWAFIAGALQMKDRDIRLAQPDADIAALGQASSADWD